MAGERGSEKLMAAWRARELTDESVREMAAGIDESPGELTEAHFYGGSGGSGASIQMRYTGDDVAWCGNDISFWLAWLRKFGGEGRPPRVIINGTPFPDELFLELDYGFFDRDTPATGPGLHQHFGHG